MTIIIDTYTVGDDLPAFPFNWGEGVINISLWTIKLKMRRPDGSLIETTAVITDGPAGDFEIQWVVGDHVEGVSPASINFDTGSGKFTIRKIAFDTHGGV